VTCFFSVHEGPSIDAGRRGSRGAGFCTESGVRSRVVTEGPRRRPSGGDPAPFEVIVRDRGVPVLDPRTTRGALHELLRRAPRDAPVAARVTVDNDYTLPLGAGFGVSGACALAATLAANEALELRLPFADCVAAAHVGEVEARSGLGDVVAQAAGGFEARLREGAPPHGLLRAFSADAESLLLVSFGPVHTIDFLARRDRVTAVNAEGERCLALLLASPSLPAAFRLGRGFAAAVGLVSDRAQALLDAAATARVEATVALLGDSLVFLDPPPRLAAAAAGAGAPFVERTRLSQSGAALAPPGSPPMD